MKDRSSGFFWPSYTDLMTSLFFVMLVLYVLTYVKMANQQRATENQLRVIREVQGAINALNTDYFERDIVNNRYTIKKNIVFSPRSDLIAPEYVSYLKEVGREIQKLIDTLKRRPDGKNIRYVVVIEGMASKDGYSKNYELSYQRALAVKRLWQENQVMPDPFVCEVQIAGSGIEGMGRDNNLEVMNQRILIQILPKIGTLL